MKEKNKKIMSEISIKYFEERKKNEINSVQSQYKVVLEGSTTMILGRFEGSLCTPLIELFCQKKFV